MLQKLKVLQLKELCQNFGLPINATKASLISRIESHLAELEAKKPLQSLVAVDVGSEEQVNICRFVNLGFVELVIDERNPCQPSGFL
jgi:hypothetical protein